MDSQLPHIDEIQKRVDATPERTWSAVARFVRGRLLRPAPSVFVMLGRLEPASGFMITQELPPRSIVLRGHHRFSRYELTFEIEPGPTGVVLSARSSAMFPGISGWMYRALVIGTGAHAFFVRRMLDGIATSAERTGPENLTRTASD